MLGITYWMLFAHQFISIETVAQVVIHDTFMFGLLYCGGVASDGMYMWQHLLRVIVIPACFHPSCTGIHSYCMPFM
mgnify:CR=1 FL=1